MLNENINKRGDSAKLAKKMGTTSGYVSQILSGESEINPTWKKIVTFCLASNKVPVLEIKDVEEYLFEQQIKSSYKNSKWTFKNSCMDSELNNLNKLDTTNQMKSNGCSHTIPKKNNVYRNKVVHIEERFDEYELI